MVTYQMMTLVRTKKAQDTKRVPKLKSKSYKNCLKARQLDHNTIYLEKYKVNVASPQKDHKEFIKNNKLILQLQQRFKSDRYNVFTEEINKIALS